MSNRTDNFNRGNTTGPTMGTPSDAGGAWTSLSGEWGISSNQGYEDAGTSQAVTVLDSGSADVEVQVTLTAVDSGAGMILRASDDNNYFLLNIAAGGNDIYKRESGGFTLVANLGGSAANGDVFKFSGSGPTLKAYRNGAQVGSDQSSAFNQTATKHGLRSHSNANNRFDDFTITDLGGGGPAFVARPPLLLRQAVNRASTY